MSEIVGRLNRTIEARGPDPLWVESRDALVAAYGTIADLHERLASKETDLASRATVPDAATEAIGRGRLHDAVNALPNHVWDAVNEIADTEGFTDALLAALDGAPEPEEKP